MKTTGLDSLQGSPLLGVLHLRGALKLAPVSETYSLLHRLTQCRLLSDTLETCAQHLLGVERSVFAINKSQTLFSKL